MLLAAARLLRRWPLLAALASLGLTGCGRGSCDVSGRVRLDGRPLALGSVVFFPTGHPPVTAPIGADGVYTTCRLPGGVTIRAAVYSTDPMKDLSLPDPGPERDRFLAETKEIRKKWFPIPDRYNSPYQSGLTITPTASEIKFDIDLTR